MGRNSGETISETRSKAMNKPMDCGDKKWFDIKMLAAEAKLSVATIRYHWRNAVVELDLPPTPAGWLDRKRAVRLLNHIRESQQLEAARRTEAARMWNQKRIGSNASVVKT